MNLGQFFSILRARWLIAALVLFATVFTTVAISLLLPKQYTAVASVVIDAKPDPVSAMMYPGMASPGYMATQVDVIQSDRVALRVVRNLKLTESPQIREQWLAETKGQGSIDVWLSDTFQKSLEVRPARESSVLQVSYRAPDPRFAAALANAFVQAYIETSLELRVDPARQYSSFFDVQVKEARDRLEAAQAKLSKFQSENGIIASDERLDIETTRLNELSTQLVMIQSATSDSSSRQSQANSGSAERMQEVLSNSVISSLKTDISRAEARLQELNSRLGENHPQVLEAKASIADMRIKMDAEIKRVTGGVSVSNSINRQREADIRSALDQQRAKVVKMKALRDEGAVLIRDFENTQRAYDAIEGRRNQTNLESQTTQSNVSVLTQATAPIVPSSPKVLLNTLLAVFLGLMLAIGCVFMLEMMDRRVRAAEDLVQALGLPLIGVLPSPAKQKRQLGKKRLSIASTNRLLADASVATGKGAK